MKKLRNFLLALIITVVISVTVLFPLSFKASLGSHDEEERYLHDWYSLKEKDAEEIPGNKLVIFGGSNVLFGVDTQRMQKELNYPVLNAGVHAAMHEYNYYWVEHLLKDGDTVIMPLEYVFYQTNGYYKEYLSYIRSYAPEYLDTFSTKQKLKFMYKCSATDLVNDDLQQVVSFPEINSGYSGKYLNANGDMTNNKKKDRLSDKDLEDMIASTPFVQAEIPSIESQNEIKAFVSYCKEHNIKLYAAWPSFLYSSKSFNATDEKKIQNIIDFYNFMDVKVLGSYKDELYDLDDFYDTTYHLNDEGKKKRTDHLLELIKEENLLS